MYAMSVCIVDPNQTLVKNQNNILKFCIMIILTLQLYKKCHFNFTFNFLFF